MHSQRLIRQAAVTAVMLIMPTAVLHADTPWPSLRREIPAACVGPVAVADGTPSEQILAMGAEARAAARSVPEPYRRVPKLLDVAEAQLAAKDIAGAKQTLAEAQSLFRPLGLQSAYAPRAVTLWIRAGDSASALALIDSGLNDQGVLIGAAVVAEAELGDFDAAFGMARRAPTQPWWLAQIAAKQCKAVVNGGKDTLALAAAEARGPDLERRRFSAVDLAAAFAACGDVMGAVTIANEFDPRAGARDIGHAVHQLVKAGDFVSAHALADTQGSMYWAVEPLAFADDQIAWGDKAGARATLAKSVLSTTRCALLKVSTS